MVVLLNGSWVHPIEGLGNTSRFCAPILICEDCRLPGPDANLIRRSKVVLKCNYSNQLMHVCSRTALIKSRHVSDFWKVVSIRHEEDTPRRYRRVICRTCSLAKHIGRARTTVGTRICLFAEPMDFFLGISGRLSYGGVACPMPCRRVVDMGMEREPNTAAHESEAGCRQRPPSSYCCWSGHVFSVVTSSDSQR